MLSLPHSFTIMARHFLLLRFHRLGLFLLNSLLRHSIRGCHTIWSSSNLWRLSRSFFAVYARHLRHTLASLLSISHWKETGCIRPGSSYSNANVRSPDCGLIDLTEGALVRGTEAVTGATLPYEDCPSTHLSSLSSTTSARNGEQNGERITAPLPVIPSAYPLLHSGGERSSSSASPDNDDGCCGSADKSSRPYQTSTSSETLHNVPLQPASVETQSMALHSDDRPATPVTHAPNTISRLGSIGSCGSLWKVSENIFPIMPEKIHRYRSNQIIVPAVSTYTISPAQKNFERDDIPDGWVQFKHPEGQPYFYYTRSEIRIITETWIADPQLFQPLDNFIEDIADFIRAKNLSFHDTDLVLDCSLDEEGKPSCGYYLVCHCTRTLFWLENFKIDEYLEEVKGELHPSHIKLFLELQYWGHWDLYPDVNKANTEILDLLTNAILDAQTDILTSNQSTINYGQSSLSAMASVVEAARKHISSGDDTTTWFVGRFMSGLWRDRFLNFHGQHGVRLSRTQSVHVREQKVPHSYLFKILSPILFSAPNVHLKTMTEIWVDRLTRKALWSEFFIRLNDEWQGHTVYASILLTANVAFLAIPSNDSNNPYIRSATQIASYVSVVTSFSGMMLALLLGRQHRTGQRGTARQVHEFLIKKHHNLETLAIVYSLPYAILMWGMVTFFLAFFIMCFEKSTMATRCVVGPVSCSCALLVAWCIWVFWEPSQTLQWWKVHLCWQTSADDKETRTTQFWQRLCIQRRKEHPPSKSEV